MEYDGTSSLDRPINWQDVEPEPFPFDLESLLAANAEIERNLASGRDENLSRAFRTPLDREAVFSNFGLMLGIFPPATFFLTFLFYSAPRANPLAVILVILANTGTALAGRKFGKVVARMVNYADQQPLGANLMLTVLIGALWGMVAGGFGGLFLFLVGSIFGAIIGGAVGAVALPAFLIPYKVVQQDGSVGLSHFLPMSVGVTTIICAFILHMLVF